MFVPGQRHGIHVDDVQEEIRGAVVGRERELRVGVAREDDQADPVSAQPVDQVPDLQLRLLEAVGLDVLRLHAERNDPAR